MGLFSGSKKQNTSVNNSSRNNTGEFAGNEGRISYRESNTTNISETDHQSVSGALELAGLAVSTVATLADQQSRVNLATVDTLTNQGGGAAKVAVEQGDLYRPDRGGGSVGLLAVGALALWWVAGRA